MVEWRLGDTPHATELMHTMLSRYRMHRGLPASQLPQGIRQDTRKHTRHILRPEAALVEEFFAHPSEAVWRESMAKYRAELERRFAQDRQPFDALAALAQHEDVYLGCSCPTAKVPDVRKCHTWTALEFMHEKYPDLDVRMPRTPALTQPSPTAAAEQERKT